MDLTKWLMEGDASVKYQVSRYLLNESEETYNKYRESIHKSGWCKKLIEMWDEDTLMWGNGIYSPKWISTTYTMLDIKNFYVNPMQNFYQKAANLLLDKLWIERDLKKDVLDLCICGMLLNLCCYGSIKSTALNEIVETLIDYHMKDGAWNCDLNRHPHHSSLHTTINVLEGFLEYEVNGYTYRLDEVQQQVEMAHEFILSHRLYKSDKSGEVIKKSFTMLSYPPRWKYDILRAMEYFAKKGIAYDIRMSDALDLIKKKQHKDGTWPVQNKHSGLVHFDYEKTGGPSRINTVRALRVLKEYPS